MSISIKVTRNFILTFPYSRPQYPVVPAYHLQTYHKPLFFCFCPDITNAMNCQVSMIALILVVVTFVCNNEASSVVANDNQVQSQKNPVDSWHSLVNVHASTQKPRTSLRELFSNGKNSDEGSQSLEERSCIIEQVEITKIPGRCIRLLGGRKACVGGDFMDPVAESCNEE